MAKTLNILLVEDDPGLRGMLTLELELASYQVQSHASAEQALAKRLQPCACACACDLAILDYDLPGMNGLALLECLHQYQAELPALIISSTCPDPWESAGAGLPNVGFLRKPFAREQFMCKVAMLLDGARIQLSMSND